MGWMAESIGSSSLESLRSVSSTHPLFRSVGRLAAVGLAVGGLVAVAVVLRSRGRRVQLSSCAFILSLVSTQLLMKELSSPPYSYKFPAIVTTVHFIAVWMFCIAYWTQQGD